jgi:hypothetical protein
MKRTNFLLLASMLIVFGIDSAVAQHALTQAQYPSAVQRTIVREYIFPATVSYVETASEHYFSYADASMTVRNVEISYDITVTDFVVHNKYVYFCGYNNFTGYGVWGWFDVTFLIAGTLNYYIYDNFECSGSYADSLFSLAVFEEQGQLHVATVGSTIDGTGNKWSCLIDITGTEGVATGWNYRIGLSQCNLIKPNRNTRVCVTDNYVVTAGEMDISYCSEGYRFHRRSDVFLAGGPQDSVYTFTSYGEWSNHNGIDMAMTHTNGDSVASAVYWYGSGSYTNPAGILVNVYDINQVITSWAVSPVYSGQVNTSNIIRDLVYSPIYKELVLLTNFNFPTLTGSAIVEMPYPLTNIKYIILQDQTHTSLDLYNGQHSILAQGYNNITNNITTYYTQPLSTVPLCATSGSNSLIPYTYASKTNHCPYTVCSNSFKCHLVQQAKVLDIPNDVGCKISR